MVSDVKNKLTSNTNISSKNVSKNQVLNYLILYLKQTKNMFYNFKIYIIDNLC